MRLGLRDIKQSLASGRVMRHRHRSDTVNAEDREKTCYGLLENAPGFPALPAEAVRFIAGGCHRRTAARNQLLYEKGETLAGFFVLLGGRVKLAVLTAQGAERVVEIVLPGQTFAESAALLGRPCPLYAQALANSRLLFVELARLRRAIERWPAVGLAMLTLMAERNQRLTHDLEACCLHSATQRLAGYLLREAVNDAAEPDAAAVTLPAAKTVVASSLNLSAETFSRELHGLAQRGLLQVARREIRIPSLARLRALSAQ
jgi:CRP/FNR family transcriptional regulator, dissimilatory nitrate respiration regulator